MHATTTREHLSGTAGRGGRIGRVTPSLEPVVGRRWTALRVRGPRMEGAKAFPPGATE